MPSVVKPEEFVVDAYSSKTSNVVPPLLTLATPSKPKVADAFQQRTKDVVEDNTASTVESKDDGRHSEYIKLVGLPFDCGMRAVKDFVQPFSMYPAGRNIFLMKDKRGRDSCKAMVRMASEEEARRAATGLHKKYMGWRYIEAYHVGEKECGWYSLPLLKYENEHAATEKRDHRYRGSSHTNNNNTNNNNVNFFNNTALLPVTFGRASAPVAYSYFNPWYMCNAAPQYPVYGQQPYCDYSWYNSSHMVPNTETLDGFGLSVSPVPSEVTSEFSFDTATSSQSMDDTNATEPTKEETSVASSEAPKKESGIFVHNPYSLPPM